MVKPIKLSEQNKDFFEKVYAVVKQIPEGRVTSYGLIARYLGMARSSRMVGWAMNASHSLSEPIPAHRVVNRVGVLTGKFHFGSPDEMKNRLEAEGVKIVDDQILNFDQHLWDPSRELEFD
jgi:methylated-DNA-protein-cysteine methyltransferase-like protein